METKHKVLLLLGGGLLAGIIGTTSILGLMAQEPEIKNYEAREQERVAELNRNFDFFLNGTSMMTYCTPRAEDIKEKIELKKKLNEPTGDLETNLSTLLDPNKCQQLVRQILFQKSAKTKN